MFCFLETRSSQVCKKYRTKIFNARAFCLQFKKKSLPRMCIFVIGLFDKLKNYKFSGFSYFVKNVSGHGLCCVPFSESACNTENNDTKYAIEFRILSLRKTPWTTQSLNLASDIEAWCTVRPYSQAVVPYHVTLQPGELIQFARFWPKMVECVEVYQNNF